MSKASREAAQALSFGLIALVRRLGGDVTLTKAEVDETGNYTIEPIYDQRRPLEVRLKVRRKADVRQ